MFGFSTLIILFLLLLVLYFYKFAKDRPKNFPPGPIRLPIWGSYWFILKENYYLSHLSLDVLRKRYKSDILGFFLGDLPTVVTFSNELTKEMVTREEFVGRVDSIIVRARSVGKPKGLFFNDGPVWEHNKTFSLRHLRDFGFSGRSEVMENFVADEVKYVINYLNNEPKEEDLDVCRGKGQVWVPNFFYGPLLNCVLLALTSTQFDRRRLRKYAVTAVSFVKSVDATGGAISMTPWLRFFAPDFFGYGTIVRDNRVLLEFLKEAVDEHVKTFSDDHHRDLIDAYISATRKEGSELDYAQLLIVVLDYMVATPIGLGMTLSFYLAYLVRTPRVQAKIQEEIDRVVGQSRLPHLDDRKDMPYLEATTREVLRIAPVVPLGVPRRCIKDTTLGGYFIPKDTMVLGNFWTAHRDERVWKDPEEFQPERFLDSNGNLLKTDFTMGFGGGKRSCAGETFARKNLFLFVAGILQNFTLESPVGKPVGLDIVPGLVLSLKDTWIQAVPR